MDFRLLGPVEVWDCGRTQWIGGRRERTVLALLLLAHGRVVAADRMIDVLWPDGPPVTARRQVHTAVSALRRVLGTRLITADPGYLLQVESDELDLRVFESQVAQAQRIAGEGRPGPAANGLRTALEMWRGPALGGVTGLADEAVGLQERRLTVVTERVELDLAAGRHVDLIAELPALIAEYPLTERFRAQFMLALYRAGRQAEALRVYRDARRTLVEHFGLEPNDDLCRLEKAILDCDPRLDLPSSRLGTTARLTADVRRPCLLPADIADFTGRADHIHSLCTALAGGDRGAIAVCAVAGPGGVGKTTLAVHVAHRLKSRFPDGQLYADLHGADAGPVTTPAEVLARFLRAMGVDGSAIPAGVDERAELYRERLAGRRVLVLLDNARDEEQVRPLLPGDPGCGVLVTSRARLGALAGSRIVDLDVLAPDQAVQLLARIVGARLRTGRPGAAEVVRLCGYLPLAVRIAGAKLAARPHWEPADLARRLADDGQRLDELAHGGLAVRASIGLSYRDLDPDARRLFRHLGRLPVAEFASWACAAVLDTSCAAAQDIAERLVDVRLLQAIGSQRYRFHDLVWLYARERATAEADLDGDDAAQAPWRALGAWLALAERAHRMVYGGDYLIVHGDAPRWLPAGNGDLLAEPLDWFETERPALVAMVRLAAAGGLDEYAWNLAHSCVALCAIRWHLDDWQSMHRHAMSAVRRAGNRRGEAAMLYGFGAWHDAHGRYRHGLRCLQRAAVLYEATGDRKGCGLANAHASHLARRLGLFELALASAERGRVLTREVRDRAGEAAALRSIAQTHLQLGSLDRAERALTDALASVTATGNRRDQAQVLHEIGELHLLQGAPQLAEEAYRRALEIVRGLGDRVGESFALKGLGLSLARQGRLEPAESSLAMALTLARETGIRVIEGRVLMEYGELARIQRRPAWAVSRLREAADLWHRVGMPLWQAKALKGLAAAHRDAGDRAAAADARRAALDLFRALGMSEGEEIPT